MENNYTDEEIKRIIRRKRRAKRWRRRAFLTMSFALIICLSIVLASIVGTSAGNRRYEKDIATRTVDVEGNSFVDLALSQATSDNVGGEKFWRYMGFDYRVAWCACFVSWCADKTGLLKEDKLIKYAGCGTGAEYFKKKGRWLKGGETPKGGDVIFFSWKENNMYDHTGIVTGVVGDYVYTIEGNSSDMCRRKRYRVDNPVIKGYGQMS